MNKKNFKRFIRFAKINDIYPLHVDMRCSHPINIIKNNISRNFYFPIFMDIVQNLRDENNHRLDTKMHDLYWMSEFKTFYKKFNKTNEHFNYRRVSEIFLKNKILSCSSYELRFFLEGRIRYYNHKYGQHVTMEDFLTFCNNL